MANIFHLPHNIIVGEPEPVIFFHFGVINPDEGQTTVKSLPEAETRHFETIPSRIQYDDR